MTHRRHTLRAVLVGLLAAAALLGGCASSAPPAAEAPTATATVTPSTTAPGPSAPGPAAGPEGFRAVTVVVTAPDGTTQEWCLWLADTPELRARGLMGVTDPDLGGLPGMVFAFPADNRSGFWMKDTLLPLSIAFYASSGALVSTFDMHPCPAGTATCPSYTPSGPYRYAVEVPQGELGDLGLVPGSTLALGSGCATPAASAV